MILLKKAASVVFDRNCAWKIFLFLSLLLPWINPLTVGPASGFHSLLLSAICAGAITLRLIFEKSQSSHGAYGWIFMAWLSAGVLSVLMGLLQYYGHAAFLQPWISPSPNNEAFANLRQRNQFATLTNIGLVAVFWIASRGGAISRGRIVLQIAAALLTIGNAATSSRTGLMQLLLLGILVWSWGGWRWFWCRRTVVIVVIAYGAGTYLLPWFAGQDVFSQGAITRLFGGDAECSSRLTLWSNVLHLIAQKPWLGWGWGELDYAHYITLYDGPRFCDILDNAHNLPLHLAVELGIPVAVMLCGGATWWIVRQKPWRETDPTRQMAWAVLAVILLHSMLEYPLWYGPFQMAAGLCVFILWRRGAEMTLQCARVLRAGCAVVGVATLAACAYAAWDYHRISQLYLPPSLRDAAYRENTLDKVRDSWLFADQVAFAELSMTALTPATAQWMFDTSQRMLHFSPEPRVIERLIESATMLGREDVAVAHLARLRAAFPVDYGRRARASAAKSPGL